MKAYHDMKRPGLFLVEDDEGQVKAAAIMSPIEGEPASSLFYEDGVSLTLLVKLAQEWFPGGRRFYDWWTKHPNGQDTSALDNAPMLTKTADNGYNIVPSIDFGDFGKFDPFPMPDLGGMPSTFNVSQDQKDREMELWKKWKNKGDMRAMNELIRSYESMNRHRTKPWTSNSPLPKAAVEAEGRRLIRKAIETYDPSKGAALNTHVWSYLNKVNRYGYTYQNIGSIPEPRAAKIGQYQRTYGELREDLGREPTTSELQENLGWKVSDLKALDKELRNDLDISQDLGYMMATNTDPAKEALFLTYYDASPQQKLVMEYTFDEFKQKPTLKNDREIAKKVGISADKVRKEKRQVAENIRSILDATPPPQA